MFAERAATIYGEGMLTTGEVAAKRGVSIDTVDREIERGNLQAKKLGRYWGIEEAEAERWAAAYQPYAGLRKTTTTRENQ